MVTHSQGAGKYLFGKYARDRSEAMADKRGLDSATLDWLDITGTEGTSRNYNGAYKVDTVPLDPRTEKRLGVIDTRELADEGAL